MQSKIFADKKPQISSINITLGTTKNCEIVFINGPSDFFVQLHPDYLELESLMNNITETYDNNGKVMQVSEIQSNTFCIAQYTEDLKWYRAVIKSVEGSGATVEFVDYGNVELVEFSNMKVIEEEFVKLPMQAIHCKLLGLTSAENKENEYANFVERVEGKSLKAEFVAEENGIYEVLLREVVDDKSTTNYINEEFCTSADLTRAKETASRKVYNTMTKQIVTADYAPADSKWQPSLYDPETKHDVIVTWFINPHKFYCQSLAEETKFKTMMNDIQKTYAGREPVTHRLEVIDYFIFKSKCVIYKK